MEEMTDNQGQTGKAQAEILAFHMLPKVSKIVSPVIDHFSNWLIGGFAAASALFLSQYSSVINFLDPSQIRNFLVFFVFALLSAVLQKFFYSMATTFYECIAAGKEVADNAAESNVSYAPDLVYFKSLMVEPLLPGFRYFAKKYLDKPRNAGVVITAQTCVRMSHWQGVACLAQAFLTVGAISYIAATFKAL